MEMYSNEYFKKLANQIMFDLSDEEIVSLKADFEIMLQQMELLNKIDTDGITEMVYPFEDETYFLREDKINHVLSQEDALENAPETKDGQIVVPKVVK
ncbi:aspartyl-tRNA(Asn)/glutamyl-tRNA(Gln) amidotransferase subunit C [Breznakia sp. PF5-3]|uniref:Asp-tRNA(Asn)/Glu-tRNA(Gln) amidotransferase subunit GatC n=1 Tax=unclassified Breznakia TaxID=2623764 RepID=UPI002404D823|nr:MULTISPECIES: Asp-tRNA(Asn)/Glu-tRNA(Gln) amidotransferase subunit GatC [unclassified Breznakia]MDF9823758.1 aspartyl-tRNA(Asn)/glutamyl-tRNA(Gln) amidotransferase subunit C [Breznakia sp. PM6-1]MDF9834556.1 aspartyl-tRNA(Asn)/glutamyl-tRNA(Gln) amidotransferase subunit C [Breznakia sp. PF5-3]MDF9838251.1 aspartyl-tRNA(Asn)/glutamyl-tRNA(Gln) amidotransferase subunit C [Breznakia sp. PFB2-8]MDF9860267.1 aspartyl-tRNA(Asn)/glutamyl-tRNA(Gln) amidotransferase subunit C [Breznakia sp. PH5-24]